MSLQITSLTFDWRQCPELRDLCLAHYQAISLDIFDTAVLRASSSPKALFKEVARRASAHGLLDASLSPDEFMLLRVNLEQKARHHAKLTRQSSEVFLHEIWALAPDFVGDKEALLALEEEVELSLCLPNPYVQALIHEANSLGLPVFFTSDTYFSHAFIRKLLEKLHLLPASNTWLILSSEQGVSKATGGLFERLLAQAQQIAGAKVVHIGDNVTADVIQARRYGIDALHLERMQELPDNELRRLALGHGQQDCPLTPLFRLGQFSSAPEQQAFFAHFGAASYGPILASYCLWVITEAQRLGVDLICPIMREARVFAPLLKHAAKILGVQIDIKSFYASRKAAFLPHMQKLDTHAINHYRRRRHFTLGHLIEELRLPMPGPALAKDLATPLNDIADQDSLNQYLSSPPVQQAAARASLEAREKLNAYAGQVFGTASRVSFLDIGPGGNTLRWLAETIDAPALGIAFAPHFLMFSIPEMFKNMVEGHQYRTYLPVTAANEPVFRLINRSPEPLEIVLTGREQTTIGYDYTPHKQVQPITQQVFLDARQAQHLADFEQGVSTAMAHLQHISRYIEVNYLLNHDSRQACLNHLHALLELPSQHEALHLGNLLFDDNCGTASFSRICDERDHQWLEKMGNEQFVATSRQQWGYMGYGIRWPQAVITRQDPHWLTHQHLQRLNDTNHEMMCFNLVSQAQKVNTERLHIYGGGKLGHRMLAAALQYGLTVVSIIDSDPALHGLFVGEQRIDTLAHAYASNCHNYVVASAAFADAIVQTILTFYEDKPVTPRIFAITGTRR